MSDTWFFIIGMPIGGLGVYLFFQVGRVAELEAELAKLKERS